VKLAYTAMHGVAGSTFLRVLEESGFPEPVIVEEQFSPDPDFPTVPFPNPEEPGAMDLALATAAEHECDVLIAHDPDGDRCAVGVPGPDGWRMLSGDEVGWLLGWWIAAGNRRLTRHCVFAESIVSGTMLKAIAEDAGIDYAQTLTGFKWIARVPDLTYGYEEALGYCVDPTGVSDKDGISAGLMVAEMVARLKQWNTDALHVLDDLAQQYGVHATRPISLRVDDLTRIDAIMSAVRADPPAAIAGIRVAEMVDLIDGTDELPATDALVFHLESGARVVIRPSGTEPKIKCYLQSVVKDEVDDLPAARAVAEAELDAIGAEVTRWLQ
jgi:phosphomannomutase